MNGWIVTSYILSNLFKLATYFHPISSDLSILIPLSAELCNDYKFIKHFFKFGVPD